MTMRARDLRVALTTTVRVLPEELLLLESPLGFRLFGFAVLVVELEEVELEGGEFGPEVGLPICEFVGLVWVGGKGSNKETKDWEGLLNICSEAGTGPLSSYPLLISL